MSDENLKNLDNMVENDRRSRYFYLLNVFNAKDHTAIGESTYHNAIMLEAKKQYPEVIANPALCTEEFLTDDLFKIASQTQIRDVDIIVFLRNAVTPVLSNTFSIAQTSTSSEQFLAQVMSAYPEKSAEFALIKQFVDNLDLVALSALNAHDYAQQILNLVNASELPQNIKDALIAGVEVSFASYELWNSGVMSVGE